MIWNCIKHRKWKMAWKMIKFNWLCKKYHLIKYGKEKMKDGTWRETKTLGFIDCGKKSYLVSINNKLL